MDRSLPDLPKSDGKSLEYNKEAQEFWRDNNIQVIEVEPFEVRRCDHYFVKSQVAHEVICQKCNFGLSGSLVIIDGKLFHNGKPLGL